MEHIGSHLKQRQTITSNGKIINISKPLVMGIVNVTSDSFFSASRFRFSHSIARRAEQIINQGGTMIDVGACSTRPGAQLVNEELELKRLSRALNAIRKKYPDAIVSIDTFRSNVAKRMVLDFGANIVNDISAGEMDPKMFETIAELKVPYILMHMKGTPNNMQNNPTYENVIKEIFIYFNEKIETLKRLGVNDIIIDPGFGFGKTIDHNFTILKNLNAFQLFELPILAGVSRKSMIYKSLNTTPDQALNGTTILNTLALQNGATILRVHDVREALETIKLFELTQKQPDFQYL
ncbi:dihydropteroate synthase [Tenuifilaceae bacterium CYCD]|nr:dihydropteroate synthase [Tenuifilaceae bacterium CYCD]